MAPWGLLPAANSAANGCRLPTGVPFHQVGISDWAPTIDCLPVPQIFEDGTPVKAQPLAYWTFADCFAYLERLGAPAHPLHAQVRTLRPESSLPLLSRLQSLLDSRPRQGPALRGPQGRPDDDDAAAAKQHDRSILHADHPACRPSCMQTSLFARQGVATRICASSRDSRGGGQQQP